MTLLRWILLLAGIVALTLFVLANPGAIPVHLWPGGWVFEAPGWQVLLATALVGFVLGAAIVWLAHVPEKRRLTRLERSAALLKSELEQARGVGGGQAAATTAARRPAGTAVAVR